MEILEITTDSDISELETGYVQINDVVGIFITPEDAEEIARHICEVAEGERSAAWSYSQGKVMEFVHFVLGFEE